MKRELMVGLVFAALIGILLGVTLWVQNPGFFQRNPEFRMRTRFHDVAGLEKGNEVWVYGTKAGRVERIVPDGKGTVEVTLLLDYDPVMRRDADVKIVPRSALGGAVVAIHPGNATEPEMRLEMYEGKSISDPIREIGETVAELKGPVREAVEEAKKVFKQIGEKSGPIMDNLEATTENARVITDDLRAGKGTLGALLKDDKMYQDVRSAIEGLRKIGDDANGGGGTIDMLLHDKTAASDLKATMANLRGLSDDLAAGRGTIGKLFKDESLYDRFDRAMKDISDLASAAKNGKGALAKLLYDEQFAKRFDTISEDIAAVTGKIRRGEGTLGKLINDETMYNDMKNALKSLGGGFEDVRENAPILTFAGFLFSGF
jgi:phospholipid/cholesterol/gamma-HCH transport system substrate-binding protein